MGLKRSVMVVMMILREGGGGNGTPRPHETVLFLLFTNIEFWPFYCPNCVYGNVPGRPTG